jgi:hypothetical protein
MAFSNLITLFIIIATAATLHINLPLRYLPPAP